MNRGAETLPARNGLPAALAGRGPCTPTGPGRLPAGRAAAFDPSAIKAAAVLAALRSSRPSGMAYGQP